jgi:hypothetical protein
MDAVPSHSETQHLDRSVDRDQSGADRSTRNAHDYEKLQDYLDCLVRQTSTGCWSSCNWAPVAAVNWAGICMVDSAGSLSARSSPQAGKTRSLRPRQNFASEWPAIKSPSRVHSKRVTNTVRTNNNHRNLHRGSRSGFAHLLSSYCSSGPSESTVSGKMLS